MKKITIQVTLIFIYLIIIFIIKSVDNLFFSPEIDSSSLSYSSQLSLVEALEDNTTHKDNENNLNNSNTCQTFLKTGFWNRQKGNLPEFNTILNLPKNKYGNWQTTADCSIYKYKISDVKKYLSNLLIIGDSRARQYFRAIVGMIEGEVEIFDSVVHDTGWMEKFLAWTTKKRKKNFFRKKFPKKEKC